MMFQVRLLSEEDLSILDAFLILHSDSSLFLRSNLRRAGIGYQGEPFQAHYVGAFRGDELVGVVAHTSFGIVLIQAPSCLAELLRFVVELSGREVSGLIGPYAQVVLARTVLGMENRPARLEAAEVLMALDLAALRVPDRLDRDGPDGQDYLDGLVVRRTTLHDLDVLARWRFEYEIEACGVIDSPEAARLARGTIERAHHDGCLWLAESGGMALAMSQFNAVLPEVVQLGGVYTPKVNRNQGMARAVIAGSLLAVRQSGVKRAVLFTPNPSALRCYAALGFVPIGDFGLTVFA